MPAASAAGNVLYENKKCKAEVQMVIEASHTTVFMWKFPGVLPGLGNKAISAPLHLFCLGSCLKPQHEMTQLPRQPAGKLESNLKKEQGTGDKQR